MTTCTQNCYYLLRLGNQKQNHDVSKRALLFSGWCHSGRSSLALLFLPGEPRQPQHHAKEDGTVLLHAATPACQQCPAEVGGQGAPSPQPAAWCFWQGEGEVPLQHPATDQVQAAREIRGAFGWFWTPGFLFVLSMFPVGCDLRRMSFCNGGGWLAVLLFSLHSLSPYTVTYGGHHLGGRGYSPFLFLFVPSLWDLGTL